MNILFIIINKVHINEQDGEPVECQGRCFGFARGRFQLLLLDVVLKKEKELTNIAVAIQKSVCWGKSKIVEGF